MDAKELKARTKQFALRAIRLCAALGRDRQSDVIGRQWLRAATAVGANYRAACKARSAAEFAARIGVVEEEADECGYWIELLIDAGLMSSGKASALLQEAAERTAIAGASRKTVRARSNRQLEIGNRQSRRESPP